MLKLHKKHFQVCLHLFQESVSRGTPPLPALSPPLPGSSPHRLASMTFGFDLLVWYGTQTDASAPLTLQRERRMP